ncbi:hypothetical protein ACHAXT_009919 [Thalassiosira profunda]
MGKKKRGANKKKKAGGRGAAAAAASGSGGGNAPGGAPGKKQYCGRREVPPSSSAEARSVGAGDEERTAAVIVPAKDELQIGGRDAGAGDANLPGKGTGADAPEKLLDGAPAPPADETSAADDGHGGETGDAKPVVDNGIVEKEEVSGAPDVPLCEANGSSGDGGPPEVHAPSTEAVDDDDEPACATGGVDSNVNGSPVEGVPASSVDTSEPSPKIDLPETKLECKDTVQEQTQAEAASADDAKAMAQSAGEVARSEDEKDATGGGEQCGDTESVPANDDVPPPPPEDDAMPTPGIVVCDEDLGVAESLSGEEGSPTKRERGQYLTQLSSRMDSISMEDVDLDVPLEEEQEPPSSPPLVRAFDGHYNGISPASQDSLSFGFLDSTESEAFGFLTESLREALSADANGDVSNDALRRYLRWKPDVNRAADRFRANRTFQSEKKYLCDNLLLSRDPKLALILKHRLIVAPEELVAKDGSAVVVIKGANYYAESDHCDDEDASRAILFVLQQVMERNTLDPAKGISIVLDLAGVTRRNVPKRLHKHLAKAQGCFPLRIRAMYVVAMPWWFPSGYARLFSKKMRARIHYLKDKAALGEFIEEERLLEEDGSISNFDVQQWISSTVLHEVERA